MSKPIIRHCFNCKYCNVYNEQRSGFCNVKYIGIDVGYSFPSLKAKLCKYYMQKVGAK